MANGVRHSRYNLGLVGWIVFLLAAAILVYQVIIPPIVGLADNGDYHRIMEPLGLQSVAEDWGDRYFGYVVRDYRMVPRTPRPFFSSQYLLGEIAVQADTLVSRGRTFDLVVLGAVHLAAYLLGIYLILLGTRRLPGAGRMVVAFAVVVAGTDIAYISTFNSFYTESASLVFLALLLGLGLLDLRTAGIPWWRVAAFFLCAALFISAKPQNFPLVLTLGLVPLVHWRRLGRVLSRKLVLPLLLFLLVFAGYLYRSMPHDFRSLNLWNTVFFTLLTESPSPRQDLVELGLDPDLARYAGVPAWSDAGPVPHEEAMADLGFSDIGLFYLRHPERLLRVTAACADRAFIWRERRMGNFTRDAGRPPVSHSETFAGWSDLERRLFPGSLWFLAAFFAVFLGVASRELIRARRAGREGSAAAFWILLALTALLAFAVPVLGEGKKDIVKHLFLFQVLFDACLFAAAAWALARIQVMSPRGWWRRGATTPGSSSRSRP